MTSTVSVGRFATMTHLSVKTLRHYHGVGLLEPAEVDSHTVSSPPSAHSRHASS